MNREGSRLLCGIATGVLALALAAAAAGCSGKGGEDRGAPAGGQAQRGQGQRQGGRRSAIVPVQTIRAESGALAVDKSTAGVISPATQSQVVSQVAGVVAKVPRAAGDWVKVGDVVVQLDDSQLRLTLATAQAALESAKINLSIGQDNVSQANPKLSLQVKSAQAALDSAQKFYDSQKALFDLGGISASALDTAASQLANAQANLEGAKTALDQNGKSDEQTLAQLKIAVDQAANQVAQAKLNLQYASIRAPFAGQIAAINLQPGMYAGLNTPVFTLVSAQRQIDFNVPPADASVLRIGAAIRFEYGGKASSISVRQAPSAPIAGVVPMVASAGGLSLPYGSVGNVVYKITLAQGLLIPMAALATLEDRNYVFVVDGENKARVKYVTIIAEGGTTAAVAGVAAGDAVIVSPPPGLIEGSQVQPAAAGQAGRAQAASAGGAGEGQGRAAGVPGQASPAASPAAAGTGKP